MLDFNWWDGDLKQNEKTDFACKFQEKLALDSKESVLQTLQELSSQQARDPKTTSCFSLKHSLSTCIGVSPEAQSRKYDSVTLDS